MTGKQEKRNLKASDFRKTLQRVELESVDGVVYLRKPPASIINYIWAKTKGKESEAEVLANEEGEMGLVIVSSLVVDEKGNPLWPTKDDVADLDGDVYLEILPIASEHVNKTQKARGEGND